MLEVVENKHKRAEMMKKDFDLCKFCFHRLCQNTKFCTSYKEKREEKKCMRFTSNKEGKSSNIISFGYQPSTMTLYIGFKNGVYAYPGASLDVYKGMLKAESRGKYFFANIRNKYESRKLEV